MTSLGKQFLSGTRTIGKAQMTISFYISIILSIILFIAIIAVIFMYKYNWKKTTANINNIKCSTSHLTQTINNQTTTTTTHPSTYIVLWYINGITHHGKVTKNTKTCTECENSHNCSPQKVDIIYNPKNTSDISLGVNTKSIIIIVLFVLMIIFIISAIINHVFRKNKFMQTLSGFETEASLVKRII